MSKDILLEIEVKNLYKNVEQVMVMVTKQNKMLADIVETIGIMARLLKEDK